MLSIIINVKNAQRTLTRCLNALCAFEDIILLDNYSTDKTLVIAANYPNVRIFSHEFVGMGKLRNLASSYAKYDWVCVVDSDEIISPQLRNELLNLQFQDQHIYFLRRYNFYANCKIEAASWEDDWVGRVYNRQQTQFGCSDVHESLDVTGMSVQKIYDGKIYHFPYDNVSQLIDKLQAYSTLYAKQHINRKCPGWFFILLRAWLMFIKCYILKIGFRYGFDGLIISYYNAAGVFSKYSKLYELQKKRKISILLDIDVLASLALLVDLINRQNLLPQDLIILNGTTASCEVVVDELNQCLVVDALAWGKDEVVEAKIKNYLQQYIDVHAVIHISDICKLRGANFLKKCRIVALAGGSLEGAVIYTQSTLIEGP